MLLLLPPQGADDDLGAKTPADIAVLGRWYARMV
jgi:hypothetical protein